MNAWNPESCDHPPVALIGYDSLIDLRRQLRAAETGETSTVIVVLDDWFSGSLSSLLARKAAGGRLVVTSVSGTLTQVAELAALCADPEACGWSSITFERHPAAALTESLAIENDGGTVVFWPSWNRTQAASQLLAGLSMRTCQPA